jgi:hypothetical protein
MSAQRTVPPPRAADARIKAAWLLAVVAAAVAVAYLAGKRAGAVQELMSAAPAEARGIAFVRKQPCGPGWCETLWLGTTREDAVQVASLAAGTERCEEIAWAKDGYRVGFVIDGYRLRVFDAKNRTELKQVDLIDPDVSPPRFVRGVTFSQNGAAVTFDECPRGRSGCKSGMAAVR